MEHASDINTVGYKMGFTLAFLTQCEYSTSMEINLDSVTFRSLQTPQERVEYAHSLATVAKAEADSAPTTYPNDRRA